MPPETALSFPENRNIFQGKGEGNSILVDGMRQGAFFLYHKETFGNQAGLMILILIIGEELRSN